MRNNAFPVDKRRHGTLLDLLGNPLFATLARLFLAVVLGLGAYIWQAELSEVPGHRAFHDVPKLTVRQRLWAEMQALRGEMTRVSREVQRTLQRTNLLLFELAQGERGRLPAHERPEPTDEEATR